jgi:hypothetical protein
MTTKCKTGQQRIATLAALFPHAFVADIWEPHRPLRVGIGEELIALGVLSASAIRHALYTYTKSGGVPARLPAGRRPRRGRWGAGRSGDRPGDRPRAGEADKHFPSARGCGAGGATARTPRRLHSNACGPKAGPSRGKYTLSAQVMCDSAQPQSPPPKPAQNQDLNQVRPRRRDGLAGLREAAQRRRAASS